MEVRSAPLHCLQQLCLQHLRKRALLFAVYACHCEAFQVQLCPEVKSGPAFIMQESFIYCSGFVKCLLSEAELHFPEFPPGYVLEPQARFLGET